MIPNIIEQLQFYLKYQVFDCLDLIFKELDKQVSKQTFISLPSITILDNRTRPNRFH
jgi:hypothetical protein